MACNQNN